MTAFGGAEAVQVRDTCMCLNSRKLARMLTARYDDALRPTGLKMTQFTVLAHVRALQPIAAGELAEQMELDQTTISRNLELMRRAAYVTIARLGRNRIVTLTSAGQAVLDAAYPRWCAAQHDATASIGGEDKWLLLQREFAAATVVGG